MGIPYALGDGVAAPWIVPEEFLNMKCPVGDPKATPFLPGQTEILCNFCFPLMVSLVDLLNLGEVTWSGQTDGRNDFKFKLLQPKGRL